MAIPAGPSLCNENRNLDRLTAHNLAIDSKREFLNSSNRQDAIFFTFGGLEAAGKRAADWLIRRHGLLPEVTAMRYARALRDDLRGILRQVFQDDHDHIDRLAFAFEAAFHCRYDDLETAWAERPNRLHA